MDAAPTPVDAAPAPVKRRAGNPCFPERGPLVADEVRQELDDFAACQWLEGDPPLRSGRYGRCKVAEGVLHGPAGEPVAELGCGIRIMSRGFVDHIGLQVGASGRRVIAGHRAERDTILCTWGQSEPTPTTRCWFDDDDLDGDGYCGRAHYIIAGAPPADVVVGDQALALLGAARIVEFSMRGFCH